MDTTMTLLVDADGLLPGIRVAGFHGRVGSDQTPARREPVLVNDENRIVRVLDVRPRGATEREVVAEVLGDLPIEGDLPGIGTRIGPYPARLGDFVVIVGERERKVWRSLLGRSDAPVMRNVDAFVRWFGGEAARNEVLSCERVADTAAWVCSLDDAFGLWKRIQSVVQDAFFRAIPGDRAALISASFWLSRAKVNDQDIYLAAEGLRRAGSPHWETLLRAGLRNRSEEERQRGLDEAKRLIDAPPRIEAGARPGPARTVYRNKLRGHFMVTASHKDAA